MRRKSSGGKYILVSEYDYDEEDGGKHILVSEYDEEDVKFCKRKHVDIYRVSIYNREVLSLSGKKDEMKIRFCGKR